MLGLEYESDALYGVNKPLTAYYSYADMREIYLYDGPRFLGTARPVATVNPLAVVLGDDADMRRISEANKKAAGCASRPVIWPNASRGRRAKPCWNCPTCGEWPNAASR